jgi:hypothetical protein
MHRRAALWPSAPSHLLRGIMPFRRRAASAITANSADSVIPEPIEPQSHSALFHSDFKVYFQYNEYRCNQHPL